GSGRRGGGRVHRGREFRRGAGAGAPAWRIPGARPRAGGAPADVPARDDRGPEIARAGGHGGAALAPQGPQRPAPAPGAGAAGPRRPARGDRRVVHQPGEHDGRGAGALRRLVVGHEDVHGALAGLRPGVAGAGGAGEPGAGRRGSRRAAGTHSGALAMSNSRARGFLEAIIAEPDDDTPRLIFADWLEEQGDAARAEFIRVQIERARLPEWDARQVRLRLRERELIEQYGLKWKWELPNIEGINWEDFRRGFVATA